MALSAAEQYLLELINRARLDPASEALRFGLDLNTGLADGTISLTAKDALAPNVQLEASAHNHSLWMLNTDTFAHEGSGGSSPGDRMASAGYDFSGTWTWRENLAWVGDTTGVNLETAVIEHHEGLYRSSGHRVNTFAEDVREIGIGQVAGKFENERANFDASMMTLNFAQSGTDVFLTGVVYHDQDNDAFYSMGEGQNGLWFDIGGARSYAATEGGYGLGVTANSNALVTVGSGAATVASLRVDLSDGNAKLDVVTESDGDQVLLLSKSATLVSGIADARLISNADLDLTGSGAANDLTGNAGDNTLNGQGGNDRLSGGEGSDDVYGGAGDDYLIGGGGRDASWGDLLAPAVGTNGADMLSGGTGNDTLMGMSGKDTLDGGDGDDVMTGGGGRDTFIFRDGDDRITDFGAFVDTLMLEGAALGDAGMTVADALALGQVVDGNAVFDFGNDTLVLDGITDINLLANALIIV